MDDFKFSENLAIVTYDRQSFTFVSIPRVLAAYLFGDDKPETFRDWAKIQIEDDPIAFAEFCEHWKADGNE